MWFFVILFVLITVFIVYTIYGLKIPAPKPADTSSLQWPRTEPQPGFYKVQNNWLKKSNSGLYELYLEGKPFERGVASGKLCKELQEYQEKVFVDQIHELVPNNTYLHFLGYLTRWFNRNLNDNIPEEYKLEISGFATQAPKEFEFIAPNYERLINYHAAHDLGHALQNYALVGCTSFAVWDKYSSDSSMIIGRNFDFYSGDKFDDNKIIEFCRPESGHKFMMITWSGMSGCVSGMNAKGLTVTINAAKSDVPTGSATPISILAREILQYASNIKEADSIAQTHKTFVSETIMVGSAADHSTALIEKSPSRIGFVTPDSAMILCANHYQSETFRNDSDNVKNMRDNATTYRFKRLQQLLNGYDKLTVKDAAKILRDKDGLNGEKVGYGNEMAMDQMLGHHSVIFKPEQLLVWVSTSPWQEGKYVCYDLNKFFNEQYAVNGNVEITVDSLEIPADSFMYTKEFQGYLYFRETIKKVKDATAGKTPELDEATVQAFINSNPDYFYTYALLGNYEKHLNHNEKAIAYYRKALTLKINTQDERNKLEKDLKALTAK